MSWTPGKKIGDEVAIDEGDRFFTHTAIRRIARETATQFILDDRSGTRIRKSDGSILGRYGSAEDVTDLIREQVTEYQRAVRVSRQAEIIHRKIEEIYQLGDEGREWIVKNIGPLMPKQEVGGE